MLLYDIICTNFPTLDLTPLEKNIFCGCYKALIEKGRKAWRTCCEAFDKEEELDPDEQTNYKLKCILFTKSKIENEVREIVKEQYTVAKHFISRSEEA